MPEEKHPYTNRLIHEKSPYLKQHAHNPVDWYPWGEEAFQAASVEDKPIFLSIGYATCHWCHVMERESFEDQAIAEEMNDLFINIKIDREELPQIDALYMELAQTLMAGTPGWPLNLILTPQLKPIFAATYLPPSSKHGLLGMKELIDRIRDVWNSDEREKLEAQAEAIVNVMRQGKKPKGNKIPLKEMVDHAAELLFKISDPVYGGIKGSPKFPIGYQQTFLMNYSAESKDGRALFLAEKTLQMMYQGGLYDHIGGGFSRYAVDEKWLVPHFEKMLYDNAILAEAYAYAWQLTGNPLYQKVANETLQYILRDMRHPEGGFYSAEDSESCGQEGLFYTWLYKDIVDSLGTDATDFCEFYNITPEGNFHGRNIPNITISLADFAAKKKVDPESLQQKIEAQKETLWKIRETAPRPFKDTKVLTSWNGLMIHTFALSGMIFNRDDYIKAAVEGASFIRDNLWKNGELLRRWMEGEARHPPILDDYAFMIRACLTLFEADAGSEWLAWAIDLSKVASHLYKAKDGAFYQTSPHDSSVIVRNIQFSDGSEPSGNAIHAENLLRLYEMTTDINMIDAVEDIFKGVESMLHAYSPGYIYHLMNLLRYYDSDPVTLVIALDSHESHKKEIAKLINKTFIPHRSIIWRRETDKTLFEALPFVEKQKPVGGRTTLYICHKGVCNEPLSDIGEMKSALEDL